MRSCRRLVRQPDAEHVKTEPRLERCCSRAVAMAADHTTNGIHSANYLEKPHTVLTNSTAMLWCFRALAGTSAGLLRTWRTIAVIPSNCPLSCLFSQATTASPGFFFLFFSFFSSLSLFLSLFFSYLGIPNNFRAHAGMQTK